MYSQSQAHDDDFDREVLEEMKRMEMHLQMAPPSSSFPQDHQNSNKSHYYQTNDNDSNLKNSYINPRLSIDPSLTNDYPNRRNSYNNNNNNQQQGGYSNLLNQYQTPTPNSNVNTRITNNRLNIDPNAERMKFLKVAEQKAALEFQIEETKRRKQQEKEKERMEEERHVMKFKQVCDGYLIV